MSDNGNVILIIGAMVMYLLLIIYLGLILISVSRATDKIDSILKRLEEKEQ